MNISNKRFIKELQYHKNIIDIIHNNTYIFSRPEHSVYIDSNNKDTITFLQSCDRNIYNITIVVGSYYPFKPPRVYINNTCYYDFMSESYSLINSDMCCLCCHCILSQWSPGFGFSSILNEIYDIIKLRSSVVNNILAKKIMEKKLGYIIPTLFEFL
jgi:ubiquitin-protein ligase